MTNLKAIIIDDEKHARESLASLLEIYSPETEVLGAAEDIVSGFQLIKSSKPDVVFLDISIGDRTGFDLLELLQPSHFQIIFTTAHAEFALKAFRVNAVDYLLKPIEPRQLIKALEKASKAIKSEQSETDLNRLKAALKNESFGKIAIPNTEGITYLDISEIAHVKGDGNYSTFFQVGGNKIIASRNLKYFQTQLPSNRFFRTHQSHLVNLKFIRSIHAAEGLIFLSSGEQIPLAKSKRSQLTELMIT